MTAPDDWPTMWPDFDRCARSLGLHPKDAAREALKAWCASHPVGTEPDLTARVEDALHRAGVPKNEAASAAGITPQMLSHRLSGSAPWRTPELAAISELTGVDVRTGEPVRRRGEGRRDR